MGPRLDGLSAVRPTNAYIHLPFCRRLCPYCDFFVIVGKRRLRPFLDRLLQEIHTETIEAGPLETIYFGGGTPSELPIEDLASLLDALRGRFSFATNAEISLEANPETIDAPFLERLLGLGVNRLSLGVQSFDDEALRRLGRKHRRAEALQALGLLQESGIPSYNVDLIHGVPGLDLPRSLESVQLCIERGVPHLSHYGLTYHEGTTLDRWRQRGKLLAMEQDLEADIFEEAMLRLRAAGYRHYEISNFAKEGHACRHNLDCWNGLPYLAFGPSGVGFTGGQRYRNVADLDAYLGGAPREIEECAPEIESVIAGLRLVEEGLQRERFLREHGLDVQERFPEAIARGLELGLLELGSERLRLTPPRGILLYDSVLGLFLDELRNPGRRPPEP